MCVGIDSELREGFCIYIDTFFQGSVPVVSDGEGRLVVFETEFEAQKEIVENQLVRMRAFVDGSGDFDDAVRLDEYVVPVKGYSAAFSSVSSERAKYWQIIRRRRSRCSGK